MTVHRRLPWILLRTAALILSLMRCHSAVAVHPFHATFAEMEWNSENSRFEVSLRLPGLQIEEELSRLAGKRVDLDSGPEAEARLRDYVSSHFQVTDARHQNCRIHWVGLQTEIRSVWAYFEVELLPSESAAGAKSETGESIVSADSVVQKDSAEDQFTALRVTNSMLVDVLSDQSNQIQVLSGKKRFCVCLTATQTSSLIDFRLPPGRASRPSL